MRPLPARLIVTLCLCLLAACTSMRPVLEGGGAPLSAQQVQTSIHPGDKLSIARVDGSMLQMDVLSVLPDALEGSVAGASGVTRVRFDQISRIERREVDGVKTGWLGAGILVIVGLGIRSLVPFQH